MQQVIGGLSIEQLVSANDDGRLRPLLAKSWTTAPDGLAMTVHLFPNAKFHDGTPVSSSLVVEALQKSLPGLMGPAFEDVAGVEAVDKSTIRFDLKRRSQFVVEALEVAIQKPGGGRIGTGPFVAQSSGQMPALLKADADYYRGRPGIDQISVTSYPTVRAAWADLLRGNLDMLNDVNIDALDSLQTASKVAVFSYVRHYQYMIVFGPSGSALKSPEIRRALSAALDRNAIVRQALNGHGVASAGPIQRDHWALSDWTPPPVRTAVAKELAKQHLKFSCLVPPDAVYERVALAVRQQLAAVGVDMQIVEASQEQIVTAGRTGNFEALLGDIVSGPLLFRSYRHFHSGTTFVPKAISTPAIDAALDQINHSANDAEYAEGVRAFERAMADEPPALFLAWSEGARAVSRRFEVPAPESRRDVLNTIYLWHPAAQGTSSN